MNIARKIDHTLLRVDSDHVAIRKLCDEAVAYDFVSVCIPPYFVKEAVRQLENKSVRVSTVVGFPFGYNMTPVKVEEIKKAIDEGADELDAVINIAAATCGDWNYLANDIDTMVRSAHLKDKQIKIILETGCLDLDLQERLCKLCLESGADFIKTSTGFQENGADPETVSRIRQWVGNQVKIKASGGIRTLRQVEELLNAGADRIGTSAGIAILDEIKK